MNRYELLSVAEAAAQIRRKRWFIYDEIKKRKLAHYVVGGRCCISQSDLDAYIARSRVPALGEPKSKKIVFTEVVAK
jgi:excisionase family DNA binding protein